MEKPLKNYVLVIMRVHTFLRNHVFGKDKKCAGVIFPVYGRKRKMRINFSSYTCQKNFSTENDNPV